MSMTGFGRGIAEQDGRRLTVELKSVNHRFLDLGMKLPRILAEHEDALRKQIQNRVARGHVDVFIKFEDNSPSGAQVSVNMPLLNAYVAAAKTAAREAHVKYDLKMSNFMPMNDLFSVTTVETDAGTMRALVTEATDKALDALLTARETEGERLAQDIIAKCGGMEALRMKIEERAPDMVEEYREKLQARVKELLEQGSIDENRLGAEIALFVDHSAIDEELVRLKSHLKQCAALLEKNEAVGRQLDFLIQEMNREVNTICSKSQDKDITGWGLQLKNEVEKIREQVQNIE